MAEALIHAFIISHIDYCNIVFSVASSIHIRPLQSVLYSAAWLITNRRENDSMTLIIRNTLNWLPIPQRIEFKLFTLVYKRLHGMTPAYLTEACMPVLIPGRSHLCLASCGELSDSRLKRKTFGIHSFSVSGSKTWDTYSA